MDDDRRGALYGLAAYVLWGLLPLYWLLLKPASAGEVLAHRFLWSLVCVLVVLVALRRFSWLRELPQRPKVGAALALAAALIAVNWWTYIYGVSVGRVVETSLGYFINPLMSIVVGVVVLKERLRPLQWVAVGVGAVAVLVLTADYGRPPWIGLVLASTFTVYALLKKVAAAPPLEGLAVESAVSAPFALAYLVWLQSAGLAVFGHVSGGHTALIMLSGVLTAVPLILFAAAANRVPLSVLGVLQYVAPTLQFCIGVFVVGEAMPAARWAGFVLVWAALAVFTVDGLRHRASGPRASEPAVLSEC